MIVALPMAVAGFGRTGTEWVPDRPKVAPFSVTAVAATTASLSGQNGVDTCRGDAGGPVFREVNGAATLVAISSTSWQHGCLTVSTTQQGSTAARTDDIADWIRQNSPRDATQLAVNAQGEVWAKHGISLYNWTLETSPVVRAIAVGNDGTQLILDNQGAISAKREVGLFNWTLESSPGNTRIAIGFKVTT